MMEFRRIIAKFFMIVLLMALFTGDQSPVWAQGHRVSSSQVTISGRSQWENWTFPKGTIVISPSGEVQAQRIEKNTNAVFDIVEYLRYNPPASIKKDPAEIVLEDAIKGGSNVGDVVNVFDGDMTTYWQPSEPEADLDLASQWFFVVDLGRVVYAKELVVKFAEEGEGDPFLLFEVLISDGLKPAKLKGGDNPAFKTVLRTLSENKTQRVFNIDLSNQQPTVQAAPVRFVQILVTGTDGPLGAEVTQEEYEQLDSVVRGATQYFKRQPDGREVPVEQELYDVLEEGRKGSIRYFRQEIPRLAELEVLNDGDELIAGILSRGGVISANTTQPLALRKFIDGDLETFNRIFYSFASAVAEPELEIFFDLNSFYWIDAYRLAYNRCCFPSYRMDFSDGSLAPDGSLRWNTAVSLGTRPHAIYEGTEFTPIKARYGRFQWTAETVGARSADIAELQFYGQGFQPEVSLTSELIRLGGSRNLLSIEWDADTPPGTEVRIQTRTGNELGEIVHYFKKDGTEVSEADYKRLLKLFRGDTVAEQVPGNDWSEFSEFYENTEGSAIASPSPREFLEVKATLISEDPNITPSLRSIRLDFSSPIAQSLQGEITPIQVEDLGVKQPFSFYVRPKFDRRDPGFNEMLLIAPGNMEVSLLDLFAGRATDFSDLEADVSALSLADVEVVPTGADSLHLRFSEVGPNDDMEIIRLDFETSLFVTGAVLQVALRNSTQVGGGAWQRVDPGDAVDQILSNTTTVVASVKNKALFTDVRIQPAIFSPNGDGINDQSSFSFNVVRVGGDSPVEVEIYALDGRLVRLISEERSFSTGIYNIAWDGLDGVGQRVQPGVYVVRLSVDIDTEGANVTDEKLLRTVAVTY